MEKEKKGVLTDNWKRFIAGRLGDFNCVNGVVHHNDLHTTKSPKDYSPTNELLFQYN